MGSAVSKGAFSAQKSYRMGEGGSYGAGDRKTDAQHHRRHFGGSGREGARGYFPHQHHSKP